MVQLSESEPPVNSHRGHAGVCTATSRLFCAQAAGVGKPRGWKARPSLDDFKPIVLFYWRTAWWTVAVVTTWCQTSLSLAFHQLQTVWTPKFNDWRSSSTVLSHVVLGRPMPSPLGRWVAAMARWWSSSGAVLASKVSKEKPPEWLDPTRHWWSGGDGLN